jgi:predicted DNA-binding protein with PD1-like motif
MKYRQISEVNSIKKYAVRLFKGENVKTSLDEFMAKENITFGELRGIGALENVVLGRQVQGKGNYIPVEFPGV